MSTATIEATDFHPAPITSLPASDSRARLMERERHSEDLRGRAVSPEPEHLVRLTIHRGFPGRAWVSGGDLARPIRVHLQARPGGRVTAVEPKLGIFGEGPDVASAIEDFRAALIEHRDVLEASVPLSKDLEAQLSILRRHLRAV